MLRNKLIPLVLAALLLTALFTGCQSELPAPMGGVPAVTEAPSLTELQQPQQPETDPAAPLDTQAAAEIEGLIEVLTDAEDQKVLIPTEAPEEVTDPTPTDMEPQPPETAAAKAEPEPSTEKNTAPTGCQHSYGSEKTVAATCTEAGYTTHTCTLCGKTETYNRVSSTGHAWVASEVHEPTCKDKGYTLYTCSRCGTTKKDGWTESPGHSWSAWTQTKAPTCSAVGTETRTCSRCGAKENRDLAKAPHSYQESTTAATCTEAGYTTRTCTVCKAKETTDKTAALGHDLQFTKTVAPTTSAEGYDLYTCSRCGATEHRNKTDKLEEVIDLNEVVEYGLAYAQSLGYTVDRSMNLSNSSYYPGYAGNGYSTDFLKARAVGRCQSATDDLIAGGADPRGVARCNFYASYDKEYPGKYYIVFLYG